MRCRVVSSMLVMAMMASFGQFVEAAGPGVRTTTAAARAIPITKTVTTSLYTANLSPGDGSPPDAQGVAQYRIIRATITIWALTWTTEVRSISVNVTGVPSEFDVVNVDVNGGSSFGSGLVTNGSSAFSLSTATGATIPNIVQGDVLNVIAVDTSAVPVDPILLVSGAFGPPITKTVTY
ncbi:MAG: hypothetical protein ACKV0T_18345 [Planctomycetales bacterium]